MADPKLKTAMAEIFAILKKHDIAGQVILVSESHTEFRIKINPTWSCAREAEVPEGLAIQFKASRKEYPDPKKKHQAIENTAHMVLAFRDISIQNSLQFGRMVEALETQIKIDHTPFAGFEPHHEH